MSGPRRSKLPAGIAWAAYALLAFCALLLAPFGGFDDGSSVERAASAAGMVVALPTSVLWRVLFVAAVSGGIGISASFYLVVLVSGTLVMTVVQLVIVHMVWRLIRRYRRSRAHPADAGST